MTWAKLNTRTHLKRQNMPPLPLGAHRRTCACPRISSNRLLLNRTITSRTRLLLFHPHVRFADMLLKMYFLARRALFLCSRAICFILFELHNGECRLRIDIYSRCKGAGPYLATHEFFFQSWTLARRRPHACSPRVSSTASFLRRAYTERSNLFWMSRADKHRRDSDAGKARDAASKRRELRVFKFPRLPIVKHSSSGDTILRNVEKQLHLQYATQCMHFPIKIVNVIITDYDRFGNNSSKK